MNHVCFGENHIEEKFKMNFYNHIEETFTEKEVPMNEAMHNMIIQCLTSFKKKMMNPITRLANMLFGIDIEMEAMHPKVKENGRKVIDEVLRFVHDRKNGVTKSKMQGVDLLSVFLENQDIFTDEDIAKNLLGFQFAATETIDYGT